MLLKFKINTFYLLNDNVERESTTVWVTYKIGKERGNSYRKMNRSLDKRHTQIQGSLTEIFQGTQMSF